MADPVDLTADILDAAANPAEVDVDGTKVVAPKLADIIAADKYLKGQAAIAAGGSGWNCLRPARVVPPGAIGPRNTEAE